MQVRATASTASQTSGGNKRWVFTSHCNALIAILSTLTQRCLFRKAKRKQDRQEVCVCQQQKSAGGPSHQPSDTRANWRDIEKRHYETLSNHVWKQEIIHWCKDVQGRGYAWPIENCCAEMSWDVGTGYAPTVEDCCAESCATCVLHSCYIWTTCIVLHFIFFLKEVKGHRRPHIFFLSCFPLSWIFLNLCWNMLLEFHTVSESLRHGAHSIPAPCWPLWRTSCQNQLQSFAWHHKCCTSPHYR